MSETLQTLRAAWPVFSSAFLRGQIFRPQCHLVEPDDDIQCDYDVEIPMSEGYALTANVFRSKRRSDMGEPTPAIMCAHPYDNHLTPALNNTPFGGPPQQYRMIHQPGKWPTFSTLTSWEAPDPNFWVPAGYCLVNLNLPGYANSGGPASIMSEHQGKCYGEAIEWVAAQPWCGGAVGLCGVSYLAISQYRAAACEANGGPPPALKCICPWEGVTDPYRDLACPGGVSDKGFLNFWWHTEVKGPINNTLEEVLRYEDALPSDILTVHPLFDEFWKGKAIKLENIKVPMLICGSFSDHELHTMGSFRAYERTGSDRKWVYTHRGGKWSVFYSEEALSLVKDFMDHFLKGVDNRFSTLPPVRLEVRSARDEIHDVRWESAWPLPATQYCQLYLGGGGLAPSKPDATGEISYSAEGGSATFDYVFDVDTELSGYMKLKLWVEARPAKKRQSQPDDMILCVYVDKLDGRGHPVRFNGSVGLTEDTVTRGFCRVSRRALDPERSSLWRPVPLGTSDEKISKGEIVPVEIALRPSSTFFARGEKLRLIVSSREKVRSPIFLKDTSVNAGLHILHFGSRFDAHLLTPLIPGSE